MPEECPRKPPGKAAIAILLTRVVNSPANSAPRSIVEGLRKELLTGTHKIKEGIPEIWELPASRLQAELSDLDYTLLSLQERQKAEKLKLHREEESLSDIPPSSWMEIGEKRRR